MTETKEQPLSELDRKIMSGTIQDVIPTTDKDYDTVMHEMNCPRQTTEDISKCPVVNTWVFNKLPLTEQQKEKLLSQLILDQLKTTSSAKRVAWKVTSRKKKLIDETSKERAPVKVLTKSNSHVVEKI